MRLVGFSGSEPIWAPEDRTDGEEVAEIIDRIYRERQQRRTRAVIHFGEPEALSVEDLLALTRPLGSSMRPDEYLDAMNRRGLYVACRRVETITQEQAREIGLL